MWPLHEAEDQSKVAALAASMDANGWQGSPLVIWGEQLLTGSHRYAAALSLDWQRSEIPTIAIEDVFSGAGLDFEALHYEYNSPTTDEWNDMVALLNELPESVRDAYGIDAH